MKQHKISGAESVRNRLGIDPGGQIIPISNDKIMDRPSTPHQMIRLSKSLQKETQNIPFFCIINSMYSAFELFLELVL